MTTEAEESVAVEIVRGRPRVHTEPWAKITAVLLVRHVGYLDLMSVGILMRHQRSVARAEIIRAFVEFMEQSGIDFTQFSTIDEMTEYLVNLWSATPGSGRLTPLLESSLFHPAAHERE